MYFNIIVSSVCNNSVEHKLWEFNHMLYDKLVIIKRCKETKWTGTIFSTSLSSVYKKELITNLNWNIMSTIHENNLNSPRQIAVA